MSLGHQRGHTIFDAGFSQLFPVIARHFRVLVVELDQRPTLAGADHAAHAALGVMELHAVMVAAIAQIDDSGGQEEPIGNRPAQSNCSKPPMINPVTESPQIQPINGAHIIG